MSDFLIEEGFAGSDYAVESEGTGPRFPWLQASCYKPLNTKVVIGVGLTSDALEVVSEQEQKKLSDALSWGVTSYDDEGTEVKFGAAIDDVRWVILSRPKIFGMVKETEEIVPLTKGLKGRGEVTVSQVLLACIAKDSVIKDSEGKPQIFTLKLRSSKTALLGSDRDKDFGVARNGGHKTIGQLNAALTAHAKVKPGSWLGHTVSVQFAAVPEKFESNDGQSSLGVRFIFKEGAGARPLSKDVIKDIHALVTSPDFKELAANPFAKQPKKEEEEYSFVVSSEGDVAPIAGDW